MNEPAAAAPAAARAAEAQDALTREALLANAWVDRDLSWLEFNRRVLHEARDERTPLLERLKFLAIFSSNLDEFTMKRIGLLRGRAHAEDEADPYARMGDSRELLAEIRRVTERLCDQQAQCFLGLLPPLRARGIFLKRWEELSPAQHEEAGRHFDSNVSPALTPLSLDPAHPFPFMSNLSTNWSFVLAAPGSSDEPTLVRVKIPANLPGWIQLKADVGPNERHFLALTDLVRHNAWKLFPGLEILDATLFRIFRNAEVELDEEDDSIRDAVEEAIRARRFQPVVEIDFVGEPNPLIRRGLQERFQLGDDDLQTLDALMDYTTLFQIAGLEGSELRDPPFTPLPHPRLVGEEPDVLAAVQAGDVLVHHPYDSFDQSVERFIAQAAEDPAVVAIKMTAYRLGDDTPFVRSLIRAAESGKQVACVVELKARFDEARNLHWAEQLEAVGAHVSYGVLGLKTHSKIALVVRKEAQGLRCYAHVGTGNYHVKTARLYTDVGLLTCDAGITADVVNLFHYFTGRARAPEFRALVVAPFNMRERFLELIRRETDNARAGKPARIVAKMNQLEDIEIGRALVAASRAGVPVDLLVRGFCCLRPGVPGWTDNVRVRSVIGRFLEHSRIFWFAAGATDPLDGEFLIGSGDWMFRNLSRRVEVAAPIVERSLRERLWEILQVGLADQRQAWLMQPDGTYVQLEPAPDAEGPALVGTHAWFMELARRRAVEF